MEKNWLSARNNHSYENGRRYHGFRGEFPFHDDLDAWSAHGTINTMFYLPLVSPIGGGKLQKNHKVLEFATGSGSWSKVILQQQPGPRLTGIDQTYMPRETNYIIHHNLEADWPFTAKQAFHLIHAHNNEENERKLVALRHLGKRINIIAEQKDLMLRAGFVVVGEQYDPRLKNIGTFYQYQIKCALEDFTLRLFIKTLDWFKENTDALLGRVRGELRLYSNFHLINGKKPTGSAR
ncbi:hypothetical protein BDV11DRAFT_209940 [Aspergillus similis]